MPPATVLGKTTLSEQSLQYTEKESCLGCAAKVLRRWKVAGSGLDGAKATASLQTQGIPHKVYTNQHFFHQRCEQTLLINHISAMVVHWCGGHGEDRNYSLEGGALQQICACQPILQDCKTK